MGLVGSIFFCIGCFLHGDNRWLFFALGAMWALVGVEMHLSDIKRGLQHRAQPDRERLR